GGGGGGAEVVGLVAEQLDLEHVAGLGSLHVHRSRQRVAEAEVEGAGVGVGALAGELAVEAVRGLEPDLLTGGDLGDRLEVGVPAVVHQSSPRARAAARRHVAVSSAPPAPGPPTPATT